MTIAQLISNPEGKTLEFKRDLSSPRPVLVEDMRQGVSKIRNPVIARVFRELDLIEQWGSGIPQIFAAAQRMKLPEPRIMEIGMLVRVTVFLSEAILSARPQQGTRSGAQLVAVVEALSGGSLSAAELIAVLRLKSKTGAFKRTTGSFWNKG